MQDKPYSFASFARLQPNQAATLGLQPGQKAELVTIEGPGGAKFTVAKKIAGQFQRFVNDLGGRGYQIDPKQSGGYANRNIRGSNNLSQHAYGNAIDLNWNANPLGSPKHNLPADVGDIASKYGLVWGGTFSRPDPMHFEVSRIIPDMPYDGTAAPASNGTQMAYIDPTNPLSAALSVPNVRRQPAIGATVAGGAPAGGPAPMPVEALQAPSGRYSKLAEALMMKAAGVKPGGWGEALNALGSAALGYTIGDKEEKAQQQYQSKLSQMLAGATTPESLSQTLIASGDPDLVKQGVTARLAQAKPKSEIGRFRPTKQGVVDTTTGQIVPGTEQSGADQAEYGTSPQYIRDKDGKLRIGQLSKAGGIKLLDVEGDVLPGIDKIDTGTEVQLRDKRTGEIVVSQPKDILGKESQEEIGKLAGQARVSLPAARTALDNARQTIAGLRNHPGLDAATGLSNWTDPRSWVAGTDAYDFLAKNQQATGQSFMIARDALKGAGQVTDFEGAKGEQAISNLNAAQSKKQYLEALDTLERMMDASYRDLETKANAGASPAAQASPASTPARAGPKQIQSQQEYQALPPGTQYVAPDGSIRTKR